MDSFRSKHDNYVLARTEVYDILTNYWHELCDKYNIIPELFIVDNDKLGSEMFKIIVENFDHQSFQDIGFIKRIVEDRLRYLNDHDALMSTFLIPNKKPLSSVFITYEDIECILDTDKPYLMCIEYLKSSLLHEMGHCISNEERYVNDEHAMRNIKEDRIIQNEYIRYIDTNLSDDPYEWQIAYYHSPMELRANNAVGLTAEEIVLFDMVMCDDI
jgi:hypothetical protein